MGATMSQPASDAVRRSIRAPVWPRLAVVQALQLPAAALAIGVATASAVAAAGLWGSVVCCAGTDSGWRWLNRLLVLQATGWLVIALVAATPR